MSSPLPPALGPGLFSLERRLRAAEERAAFLSRAVAVLAALVADVAGPGSAAAAGAEALRRCALAGRPVFPGDGPRPPPPGGPPLK